MGTGKDQGHVTPGSTVRVGRRGVRNRRQIPRDPAIRSPSG
jgi:hypothetical protein